MIRDLTSSGDPLATDLLHLAHRLFPTETLEPEAQLRNEMDGLGDVAYLYVVSEEEGLQGFVRFARLSFGATFVVHLAVEPAEQGRGIGHDLLRAVQERGGGEMLLAEVEPGRPMEWWLRQGARSITPTYTQPALRPDTEPVPMTLMAIDPVGNAARLVEAFYREVWRLPVGNDLVRRAVAGVVS